MDTSGIIAQIVDTTLNSFDFVYCLIVNILTYTVIKIIDEANKDKEVKTWVKHLVLLASILSTGVVYYLIGQDVKLLFNSAILAPVAWNFIFKPIAKKLGLDYKEFDSKMKN